MKTRDEDLILEELRKGTKKTEIVENFGVSKSWLYRFANKNGYVKTPISQKERENIKSKLLKDYSNGYTYKELVSKYGYSKTTIGEWVKDSGLTRNKRYSDNLKRKIMREYLDGLDSVQLSDKYGVSQGTITSWLREKGLTRKRGPESLIKKEDYFDNINTEGKAYFLGLIMADGNTSIYNGQYSLKLSFQKRDGHIIEDFLKEIDSKNSVYSGEGSSLKKDGTFNQFTAVSLTSRYMVERLFELGVIPRKTGFESFPKEEIPENLHKDFFRGYFDGDGSITASREGYLKMNLTSASKELIISFLEYMGWDNINIHSRNNAYIIYPRKNQAEEFYKKCYKNSNFHIKRKKETFEYFFKPKNSPL